MADEPPAATERELAALWSGIGRPSSTPQRAAPASGFFLGWKLDGLLATTALFSSQLIPGRYAGLMSKYMLEHGPPVEDFRTYCPLEVGNIAEYAPNALRVLFIDWRALRIQNRGSYLTGEYLGILAGDAIHGTNQFDVVERKTVDSPYIAFTIDLDDFNSGMHSQRIGNGFNNIVPQHRLSYLLGDLNDFLFRHRVRRVSEDDERHVRLHQRRPAIYTNAGAHSPWVNQERSTAIGTENS